MKVNRKRDIFLVLDNVRSAYNVGAIFRTADAAGVERIYLCGITPIPDSGGLRARRDIQKTALGAESFIPWEYSRQTARAVEKLKAQGVQVVALEQGKSAVSFWKFRPRFPLALIVGNEVTGVTKSVLKRSDKIIEIPMHGKKESLNVSVACGVALFVLRRDNI